MKVSYLALPLLALTAAPAMAQDAYADGTGDNSWSGVYVGGTFGIGAQTNDRGEGIRATGAGVPLLTACNGASTSVVAARANCTGDRDGYEYSARIGADQQVGKLVYGFVVDAQRSESVDSATLFTGPTNPTAFTLERELDLGIGARGRFGIAPGNGDGLFYMTGGVNYGRINHNFRTNVAGTPVLNDDDKWQWGYSAGGGAEVKLARNLSWGVEYLFTRYEDDDFSTTLGTRTYSRSRTNFDQHNLRTTLAFRF